MNNPFNKELSYIKNPKIKNSLKTMISKLPDYFFEVPASSTGKYHPEFSLGDGGLYRHTKAAVRIAVELFNDPSLNNFTSDEKDLIIMSNYIKENKDDLELTNDELDLVCRCIATHMGPWTKNYKDEEVLEAPKDKYQRFVHMCDYLASRKFLDVKFENNEIIN